MPKWTMEGTATLQLPTEAPKPIAQAPSFEIKTNKGIDEQLANRIEELARERQKQAAKAAQDPTLVVNQAGEWGGGLRTDTGIGFEAGIDRLAEARKLIEEKDYQGALGLVEQVLHDFAAHEEAIYLKAYCQFLLEQHEPALETLFLLRHVRPTSDHASQIRLLRGQVRDALIPLIIFETIAMSAFGIAAGPISHLRRLIELDPEGALFHMLLIQTLIGAGNFAEAAQAANAAAPFCHGTEQEILVGLRGEIERRDVLQKLDPARTYYREAKYRKARGVLEKIRPNYGNRPLWITFNNYLQRLGGGLFSRPLSPAAVCPEGSTADVEALHFFLVGPDIRQAKKLLGEGSCHEAEIALRSAYDCAPYFPYLNFLLGVSIFKGIWADLGSGNAPDLDSVFSLLSVAREFAEAGARDPEIGEAPDFIQAIDGAKQMFRELKAEIERQQREQKLMEPLFHDFTATMETIKDGIRSTEQYRDVEKRLKSLRERGPAVGKQIQSDQGRENFLNFEQVLQSCWDQLGKLRPDIEMAEKIGELRSALENALKSAPFGISGWLDFQRVESALRGVRDKIQQFRNDNRNLSQDAGEAVDQIEAAVNRNMAQLDGMRGDMADSSVVDPLIGEFTVLMKSVEGGIQSRDQLWSFRNSLQALSGRVGKALSLGMVAGERARQNLQDLDSAVDKVLGQVRGL